MSPQRPWPPDKLPPRTPGLCERLLYGGFISPSPWFFSSSLRGAFLITLPYSSLSTSLYYLSVAHNGSHSACSHCILAPSPLWLLPFVSTLPRLIDASAGRSGIPLRYAFYLLQLENNYARLCVLSFSANLYPFSLQLFFFVPLKITSGMFSPFLS